MAGARPGPSPGYVIPGPIGRLCSQSCLCGALEWDVLHSSSMVFNAAHGETAEWSREGKRSQESLNNFLSSYSQEVAWIWLCQETEAKLSGDPGVPVIHHEDAWRRAEAKVLRLTVPPVSGSLEHVLQSNQRQKERRRQWWPWLSSLSNPTHPTSSAQGQAAMRQTSPSQGIRTTECEARGPPGPGDSITPFRAPHKPGPWPCNVS